MKKTHLGHRLAIESWKPSKRPSWRLNELSLMHFVFSCFYVLHEKVCGAKNAGDLFLIILFRE